MELETLRAQLKALKLNRASAEIDDVIKRQKKAVQLAWVSSLMEREIDARKEASLKSRIACAKFPEIKYWESFDWNFNPELDQAGLEGLKNLAFIKENRIVQFLGQTGTGKSHLATALGLMALYQGHRVYWTSAKVLQATIKEAKLKNKLNELFKKILTSKLWVYDDFGVVTYSRDIAEEVFDLLDRRKQHAAMILTSNRDVEEWPSVFPDAVLANATIDRMFEHAITFEFKGDSFRLKGEAMTVCVDERN